MANNSSTTAPGGALNQNAFLQLLTMQMKYQDPLSPQDSSAFVAQLAQFSSLEQMTNVASTDQSILQTMTSLQAMTQMSFAHQLIGETVTVNDSNGQSVTGPVSSIQFQNGDAQLVIGGTQYPLTSVVEMGSGSSGP